MREVVATSSVPARGAPVSTPRQNPPQRPAVPADRRPPADQAELSAAAAEYQAASDAAVATRMNVIRAQIADGTYLTPEKLEVVVERLLAELTGT